MNYMEKNMRYLLVLPCICILQGCWFFIIPLKSSSDGDEGQASWNACIQRGQFAGDRIKHIDTGQIGKVVKVFGPSSRCKDHRIPNLAEVVYE